MKDDMQYINVEGSGGMVRDKETGAILNTNKSEIERARKRKIISKKKEEEFDGMKTDIKGLKDDMVELKSLLNKIANGW